MQRRNLVSKLVSWLVLTTSAFAQTAQPSTLEQVLERLNRIEQDNQRLRAEVAELRSQISGLHSPPAKPEATAAAVTPTVEERLEIAERRIEEQASVKVEASQRFPVRFSGILVANLFRNGPHSGGYDTPTTAAVASGQRTAGMTFRQSIIGFDYLGGQSVLGARVHGSLFMDFYEGFAESGAGYSPIRLRTAAFGLDWQASSISFAVDKPIFSPRDPSSFSYFGISPLTGSGNLWRWQPQIRAEHRVKLSPTDTVRAQAALFQTYEDAGYDGGYVGKIDRRRPGLQGRFEYSHSLDEGRRIEFAPAFHVSSSHIDGHSIPSRLFSLDWFANPLAKVEFSGAFFSGRNIHHLGALRQGFQAHADGSITAVHSRGGWSQLSFPVTPRLTFNVFGGIHDDRNRDLTRGIAANRTGAANIQYRIAPNVILSLEAMQMRTTHLEPGLFKNNRYDLAVAYLF